MVMPLSFTHSSVDVSLSHSLTHIEGGKHVNALVDIHQGQLRGRSHYHGPIQCKLLRVCVHEDAARSLRLRMWKRKQDQACTVRTLPLTPWGPMNAPTDAQRRTHGGTR
jgi:hypothetical protein